MDIEHYSPFELATLMELRNGYVLLPTLAARLGESLDVVEDALKVLRGHDLAKRTKALEITPTGYWPVWSIEDAGKRLCLKYLKHLNEKGRRYVIPSAW